MEEYLIPIKRKINKFQWKSISKGRPNHRYMDQIEQDIPILNMKKWKNKTRIGSEGRKILEQAKTQKGLSSQ